MGTLAAAPAWTAGHVVLAGFLVLMAMFLLSVPLGVAVWTVHKVREHRTWRRTAEPFVPSRVWVDEQYGGTDADLTRRTGWLGSTETEGYNAAARAAGLRRGGIGRRPR